MKRLLGMAFLICALSASAFAAKTSQTLTFGHAVKVGTTQVPAGTYKVSWTGQDTNLQVTIAKNGKTVATVPAKLVPTTNPFVSFSTRTVEGADVLEMIQLKDLNLVLTGAPAEIPASEAH